jgi:hypothetical protein
MYTYHHGFLKHEAILAHSAVDIEEWLAEL